MGVVINYNIERIPIKQPVFHGSCHIVCFFFPWLKSFPFLLPQIRLTPIYVRPFVRGYKCTIIIEIGLVFLGFSHILVPQEDINKIVPIIGRIGRYNIPFPWSTFLRISHPHLRATVFFGGPFIYIWLIFMVN